MRFHFLAALRALHAAIQFAPIRLMGRFAQDFASRAQVVDNRYEGIHPDQHSPALAAVQYPLARHGRVNQGHGTDRTA
jgi:hypothetical protein